MSPLVGGRALKGPADRMMKAMGLAASNAGVAGLYRDFLDVLILDRTDAADVPAVEVLGPRAVTADTVMRDVDARMALARATLDALQPEAAR